MNRDKKLLPDSPKRFNKTPGVYYAPNKNIHVQVKFNMPVKRFRYRSHSPADLRNLLKSRSSPCKSRSCSSSNENSRENIEKMSTDSDYEKNLIRYKYERNKKDWHEGITDRNPGYTFKEYERQEILNRTEKEMETAIAELDRTYHEYEKNPDTHPYYLREWTDFWNRRSDELKEKLIDPSTYDFTPEWKKFFTKRLTQLHVADLELKKEQIKIRLGLSKPKDIVKIDRKLNEKDTNYEKSPRKRRKRKKIPGPHQKQLFLPKIMSPSPKRERISSPLLPSDDSKIQTEQSLKKIPANYRSPNSNREESRENIFADYLEMADQKPCESEEPLTIISALQLMTSLENRLGILGPRIIEVVSQSYAIVKQCQHSSDELINRDTNCVVFDQVKDKLNVQILHNKILSVQKMVENIATLVNEVTEKQKLRDEQNNHNIYVKDEVVKNTIDDAFFSETNISDYDQETTLSTVVSDKITKALDTQDNPNIAGEQFGQLVNAFIGILKANTSKDTNVFETSTSVCQTKSVPEFKKNNENEELFNTWIDDVINDQKNDKSVDNNSLTETGSLHVLTDADLQTVLQSYDDLSPLEQNSLIIYMKELQKTDPNRVENLKQYFKIEFKKTLDEDKESKTENSNEIVKISEPQQYPKSEENNLAKNVEYNYPYHVKQCLKHPNLMRAEQKKDNFLAQVIYAIENPHEHRSYDVRNFMTKWGNLKLNSNGVLINIITGRVLTVLPFSLKRHIVREMHRPNGSKCLPRYATVTNVLHAYFSEDMKSYIHYVVTRCNYCSHNDTDVRKPPIFPTKTTKNYR